MFYFSDFFCRKGLARRHRLKRFKIKISALLLLKLTGNEDK